MTPVSMRATSVIVSTSTAEMLLGSIPPWRLKLTAYSRPVAGETSRVAGKRPSVTSPTHASAPVSYLWTLPKGSPWASETYQWRPSGATPMPCGPSISLGYLPTAIVRTTSAPPGP